MLSTCPNCKSHLFEVVETQINWKNYQFIQCTSCGTVVGVLDPKITDLERKIRNLESSICNIEHDVHQIKNNQ
jgi:predicted Zn finger-like uncharacterized protein